MESRCKNILEALPEPSNYAQLLLQSHFRVNLYSNTKNEYTCKKCLTPLLSGQFALKFKASNHKRKRRRQHKIDKLQKALKENDKKVEIIKLKRQIEHLQKQNNHVAMYKCEICKATSSVQCWKPKKVNKHDDYESIATDANEEKQEKSTNKPKKIKTKKKKTAGLIIPPLKKTQQAPAVTQQALSIAKLSSMLQSSKSPTMSKLNQFLK